MKYYLIELFVLNEGFESYPKHIAQAESELEAFKHAVQMEAYIGGSDDDEIDESIRTIKALKISDDYTDNAGCLLSFSKAIILPKNDYETLKRYL
jgi:hypothetical protein